MNTIQRLLMVTWNANGLRSRMWELRDFVNKYKPDIISLQETWLRPSHTIALANYRIYRNDRNHTTHNAYTARTGGGTAIMIKNSMKHTHIPTPNLNGVEATMVALTPELGEQTLIISLYNPPHLNINNLNQSIDTLMNQGFPSTIIMGDFNAKHSSWGCDVDTRRGITFNHHIQRSGYRILAPPTPTRYGHDSASTLDLAISTNVDWPCTVTSISELSSDHNPVTFEFTTTTHFFPPPNKRYTHMKTNWGKFTQNLNIPDNFTLPDANTPEDIDEQIAAFTDRLHQAYKNASKPLKHNDTFYISRDLNQLFKERNRARKIWYYTRSPADKNTLNRLQKQIKKIVLKHEQKQWDESLACLEAEDGSLWKAARDSRKKARQFRPLKALPKLHIVTQTKVRS
ncbi:probable RNA-directed DNA polymerase from transposon X-element [Trichonephila clavipes]|nr:probable RNA-directed DNA polymerase from transposon X-element [Trichonephila clavipes]